MFCGNCGAANPDGAKFCTACGAPLAQGRMAPPPPAAPQPPVPGGGDESWRQNATQEENELVQGTRVSPNVYLGQDGKYRWVYEMKILKNGTMLRTVTKVITWIILATFVLITGILLVTGSMELEDLKGFLLVWLGIFVGLELIGMLSVPIYSLFMGGSYWTLFEMDDKTITQTQMKKTFQRTQSLALVLALTDTTISERMDSMRLYTQDRYDSPFGRMNTVKLAPKRDLIDITGLFVLCPVFAPAEDYDFVLHYILDHVPEKTARKFHAKYR